MTHFPHIDGLPIPRSTGAASVVYRSKILGTFPLTYIDLEPAQPADERQNEVAAHA